MMRRRTSVCALVAVALLLTPAAAQAQLTMGAFRGLATGHIGSSLGNGDAGEALSVGGSVAVIEEFGWGAEFDFGYADSGDAPGEGLDAQSYMLNAILVRPKGRLRPFGVAGVGVIHAQTCVAACPGATTWTDFGFNGGGGLQFLFSDVFGLRGDVRYFTALGDHPDPSRQNLSYWRIAFGATFLWAIAP
jgi:opacity protein-like surface antigen